MLPIFLSPNFWPEPVKDIDGLGFILDKVFISSVALEKSFKFPKRKTLSV